MKTETEVQDINKHANIPAAIPGVAAQVAPEPPKPTVKREPKEKIYPSTRYHKNGEATMVVTDEEHEAGIVSAQPGVWFDVPQPKPVVEAPKPDATPKQLTESIEELGRIVVENQAPKLLDHDSRIAQLESMLEKLATELAELSTHPKIQKLIQ